MVTELWWASIGGEKCEPIRIERDVPTASDLAYHAKGLGLPARWWSIGCADAHEGFDGVELVYEITTAPLPKAERERQEAAWKRANQRGGHRRWE